MQSIPALTQFEHGSRLLHRTFRRRQVTQLRGLRRESGFVFVVVVVGSFGEAPAVVVLLLLLLLDCPVPVAVPETGTDTPLFDGGDAEVVLGVMYMGALLGLLSLLDDIFPLRPATDSGALARFCLVADVQQAADKQS